MGRHGLRGVDDGLAPVLMGRLEDDITTLVVADAGVSHGLTRPIPGLEIWQRALSEEERRRGWEGCPNRQYLCCRSYLSHQQG